MSNDALNWAFKQSASAGAKSVLVALANEARQGRCSPGHQKLASMTSQGTRSVVRHLDELLELGLIRRERRNEGYQKRLADTFILSLDANMTSVNLAQVTVAHSEPQDAILTPVTVAPNDTTSQNDTGQNGRIKEPKEQELKTTTLKASEIVPIRQDVERICKQLADLIEANGSRRPPITQAWRDSARLLVDKDGRTEEQVIWLINWCQRDDFWRTNILSLPTFREKFDRLRLAAEREYRGRTKSNPWAEAGTL